MYVTYSEAAVACSGRQGSGRGVHVGYADPLERTTEHDSRESGVNPSDRNRDPGRRVTA